MLEAPDILIGGGGKLVGVFFPRSGELRNPNRLLTRLAICRLGLPRHLSSVLVVEPGAVESVWSTTVMRHFDMVLRSADESDFSAFLRDPLAPTSRHVIEPQLRQETMRRYSLLLEVSLTFTQAASETALSRLQPQGLANLPDDYQPAALRSWITPEREKQVPVTVRTSVFQRGDRVVGWASFASEVNRRAHLIRLTHTAVRLDYALDNGVPYLINPTINLLLVDQIPHIGLDWRTPLRAAALAGWAVLRGGDAGVAEQVADSIARDLRRAQ
jgi:hypothetical protein